MPAVVPVIELLATAFVSSGGIQSFFGPSPGQPQFPQGPSGPQPLSQQQQQQARSLISQQFPTLQSFVGGSVSPEYFLQMAQLFSGLAGSPGISGIAQGVLNQFLGLPTTGGLTTQGTTGGIPLLGQGGVTTGTARTSNLGLVDQGITDLFSQVGLG